MPDARPAPGTQVYLDHAATTPLLPESLTAMTEELAQLGNPSSLHNPGRRARRVVEESRELIAEAYGARPSEVVFTSGGTEADNLAVKGLYWARRGASPARRRVLAAATEHHAVLDSVRWLAEHEDAEADWLPVDTRGLVSVPALAEVIERRLRHLDFEGADRLVFCCSAGRRRLGDDRACGIGSSRRLAVVRG